MILPLFLKTEGGPQQATLKLRPARMPHCKWIANYRHRMQCARQCLALQLTLTLSPSPKSCCLYMWKVEAVTCTKMTPAIPSIQEPRCSRPTRPCQST
jgi:hypothetical protein